MFFLNAERKNAYKDLDLFKSSAYRVCTFRAPTENIGFRFLGTYFAKTALTWHYLLKTVNLKKCFFFFLIKEKTKQKNNIGLVPSFLRQEDNIIFYFEQSMFFFLFILERQKER